jgi:deoxyribodipyrimidine photolyase
VFCNRRYEPAMGAADAAVGEALAAAGLQLQSYSGLLLQEPWEVQVCYIEKFDYLLTHLILFKRKYMSLQSYGRLLLQEPWELQVGIELVAFLL